MNNIFIGFPLWTFIDAICRQQQSRTSDSEHTDKSVISISHPNPLSLSHLLVVAMWCIHTDSMFFWRHESIKWFFPFTNSAWKIFRNFSYEDTKKQVPLDFEWSLAAQNFLPTLLQCVSDVFELYFPHKAFSTNSFRQKRWHLSGSDRNYCVWRKEQVLKMDGWMDAFFGWMAG